jgi:probable F420-dependent oxidoreductase
VKFGFYLPHLVAPGAGDGERFGPTYDVCQLAESVGFDFVAMGHHRFTPDSDTFSASLMLLSAIAARTTTLRLSSAVYLMGLYPALDVAEQIAGLDQISDGRTMLSFGIGYRPYEYEYAGLSYAARASRLEEALHVLRQAWTQDRVNFTGRHYQLTDVPVVPRPVQRPHPPIWLGGGSAKGVDRAARLADGWMVDTTKSIDSVQRKVAQYRAAAAELGRPSQVCLMRQVGIGPTHQYVQDTWLQDASQSMLGVWKAGGRFTNGDEFARKMLAGEALTIEEFAAGRDVAGTPDECVAQISTFRDLTGCEYFLAMFGETPTAENLSAAIRLFGREVIPALQ